MKLSRFIAIQAAAASLCDTHISVSTHKSTNSASSRYNFLFDDSTIYTAMTEPAMNAALHGISSGKTQTLWDYWRWLYRSSIFESEKHHYLLAPRHRKPSARSIIMAFAANRNPTPFHRTP